VFSKYYVVLDNTGWNLLIRSTDELKDLAKDFTEFLAEEYADNGKTNMKFGADGEIKITQDRASGVDKVVAFINPNSNRLKLKVNIPLKYPILAGK